MASGHLPVFELSRKPWLKPDAALQRPLSNEELLATVEKIMQTGVCFYDLTPGEIG
jgi:uncharacterized Fe-S cluster protein YjdI